MRMKSTKQVKEDIIYTMWKNSRKISNFPSFSHAALFLFGALKLATATVTTTHFCFVFLPKIQSRK